MVLCEPALEKANRHVIEAERRITAQMDWIARLLRMSYDTADETAKLATMREALRSAHAEQSRQQALASSTPAACKQ
jgi:hypothetical protein